MADDVFTQLSKAAADMGRNADRLVATPGGSESYARAICTNATTIARILREEDSFPHWYEFATELDRRELVAMAEAVMVAAGAYADGARAASRPGDERLFLSEADRPSRRDEGESLRAYRNRATLMVGLCREAAETVQLARQILSAWALRDNVDVAWWQSRFLAEERLIVQGRVAGRIRALVLHKRAEAQELASLLRMHLQSAGTDDAMTTLIVPMSNALGILERIDEVTLACIAPISDFREAIDADPSLRRISVKPTGPEAFERTPSSHIERAHYAMAAVDLLLAAMAQPWPLPPTMPSLTDFPKE